MDNDVPCNLRKIMGERRIPSDTQDAVIKMAEEIQNRKILGELLKNLVNNKHNFWDYCCELCAGYALADCEPKYEIKYEKEIIDFQIDINGQKVWIEIKNRHESDLQKNILKQLEEVKPHIVKILEKKSSKKYLCTVDFFDIPKEFWLGEEWVKEILSEIEKIRPDEICPDNKIILKKGPPDYEISLYFLNEFEKWGINYESGCTEMNQEITRDLLVTMLRRLLGKFKNRNNNDVTIGVIDVTSRRFVDGWMEASIDLSYAGCLLENIVVGKKLANNPNRETFPWYDEVKNKIDAIFLVISNPISNPIVSSESIEIEKFISSLANENKKIAINTIFGKIWETRYPN